LKKLSIFSLILLLSSSLCSISLPGQKQKKEPPSHIKDALTIEQDLFELINKERNDHGLSTLRLSLDLSRLARQHSQDMATRQELSHLSSSGKSYEERLVEVGFYYISRGENVAFSETFVAEFIHHPLMESPEHKKNILGPAFDQVGIGVILVEKKGYYVTQDFIQSLEPEEEEKVQAKIQNKINALRRKNSLPPLVFLKEAEDYARGYAQQKAETKPPPPCPPYFGENHIVYISSPSLDKAHLVYKDVILDQIYESSGLGIIFRRNKEYPGGSYFVTLILFPENKYKYMDKRKIGQIILQNINGLRQKKGIDELRLDDKLSNAAEMALIEIMTQRNYSSILPEMSKEAGFIFFITVDPTVLSGKVKDKIENEWVPYRKIGIGISFSKNREYPRGAFWVVIFFKR
jgi:uncharacterized protein YkwD